MVLLLTAAPVSADPAPAWRAQLSQPGLPPGARIALEANVGAPSSRSTVVEPVLRELERRGIASRPRSILALLGERVALPGVLDRGTTIDDLVALSERGLDAFDQAEYRDAVAALTLAVTQIKRNPGLLVLDASRARIAFRAFVGLALSQSKVGDEAAATATMTELLRTFTTQTVSRAEYGPHAEQFYRAVQRQTQAAEHGQLVVTVDEPRAMIFVDGELRGTGRAAIAGLIPGVYRVFVQVPGSSGRQYQVAVHAEDTGVLDVDWETDAALTVTDTWAGFEFASDAEREREAHHAAALARRWGQSSIIVVDATRVGDESAVIGTVYRADGAIVRRALVVPGGNAARLYALAGFLADGTPSPELRVSSEAEAVVEVPRVHSSIMAWSFIAGGVAAVGAGIALFAIDQNYGHTEGGVRTAYYRNTTPFGVAASVAGATSLGIGLWFAIRRDRARPSLAITTSHVLAGWSVAY